MEEKERGYFKIEGDGRSRPRFARQRRGQLDFATQQHLAAALKTCDLPDDRAFSRHVFGFTDGDPPVPFGCVARTRYPNNDVGRKQVPRESGADEDLVLDAAPRFIDDRLDFEREIDIGCGSVPHQFKFAVRRHKRDGAIRFK